MPIPGRITERQFLIKLALDKYNEQYGHSFKVEDCDVKSITQRVDFDLSYEVFTNRLDDKLRIRIHLRIGAGDGLQPFRLETDGTSGVGTLDDEVFVALGTLDRYYREAGIYKFGALIPDEGLLAVIHDENLLPLMDEAGEFLLEERDAQ